MRAALVLGAGTLLLMVGSAGARPNKKEAAMTAKVNTYVAALNGPSAQLFSARRRYLEFADPQKGPDCSKGYRVKAPGTLHNVGQYVKDIEAAKKRAPKLRDLEKAGDGYIAALQQAEKLMEEVNTYYQTREFQKDSCAKGMELHGKLMPVWNEFRKNDQAIREILDQLQLARFEKEVKTTQRKYGKRIRYYHLVSMAEAKRLLMTMEAQFQAETPDLAAMKSACDKFEVVVKEIEETNKKEKDAQKCLFHSVAMRVPNLLEGARAVVDALENKRTFTRSEAGRLHSVRGSMPYLITAYNDLVKASNQVVFFKTTK